MNLEKEVFDISLKDIMPNRFQPREVFEDNALNELAASIKEHGVIQPIVVRKVGDKYEIIAGERRFRASQLVGKQTIPALVRDIDDKEAAKIALLENLQRKDLTAIEEARTYQTILKLDNITQEELASNLGKSQSTIANKLRLLNLDEEVQMALLNEKISERHARSLLNVQDPIQQRELLEKVILNRMTVRGLDEEIAKITGKAVNNLEEFNEIQTQINEPIMQQEQQIFEPITSEITDENMIIEPNNNEIVQNETESTELVEPMIEIPSYENNPFVVSEPMINNEPEIEINQEDIKMSDENTMPINDVFTSLRVEEEPEIKINYIENEEPQFEDLVEKTQLEDEKNNINTYTEEVQVENELPEEVTLPMEEPQPEVLPLGSIPVQQTPTTEQLNTGIYDLRFAINNVRQAVQNTKKFGFEIETEEFDFENVYQIVIKIDKNK